MTELSPMEAIRQLSGVFHFDLSEMSTRLHLCNLIARNTLRLADNEFTDESCNKVGIKLKREKSSIIVGNYFKSKSGTHRMVSVEGHVIDESGEKHRLSDIEILGDK